MLYSYFSSKFFNFIIDFCSCFNKDCLQSFIADFKHSAKCCMQISILNMTSICNHQAVIFLFDFTKSHCKCRWGGFDGYADFSAFPKLSDHFFPFILGCHCNHLQLLSYHRFFNSGRCGWFDGYENIKYRPWSFGYGR